MAGEIFGARLDGEVDAALVRREQQGRRPGVVHHHAGAARMGDFRDRGNVLHLETLRAGRLDQHGFGVGPHQGLDACADQRIVIGRLDAHAAQEAVAEGARRQIGGIGDEQMIAGFERGQQRDGDRGEARRRQHRSGGAGDLRPRLFQRFRRRRAVRAIGEALAVAGFELRKSRLQHRRAAIDRRVDETKLLFRVAPRMNEFRARAHVLARLRGRFGHSGEPFCCGDLADGKGRRQEAQMML